ncbi:MAG TPA: hypothetical protein VM600_01890 [Actinomycetota bacterium]|nr:hypothetical protein [Actinomycetota bacterium]
MTLLLREVLAACPFPLFALPARGWDGPAFVGSTARGGVLEGLHTVRFDYIDAIDGETMGAVVSNIDARAAVSADPVSAHVLEFVSRFDADFLMRKMRRRRKFEPFPRDALAERSITIGVAGQTTGASLFTHRELPLQMVRVVIRSTGGTTDVGLGAWRLDARELAATIEPVDVRFADAFDRKAAGQPDPYEGRGR